MQLRFYLHSVLPLQIMVHILQFSFSQLVQRERQRPHQRVACVEDLDQYFACSVCAELELLPPGSVLHCPGFVGFRSTDDLHVTRHFEVAGLHHLNGKGARGALIVQLLLDLRLDLPELSQFVLNDCRSKLKGVHSLVKGGDESA